MSVLSPIISSINGETRRIYLNQGVTDFFPIEDIYHEYRNRRRTDETLRKWTPLLRAEGNVPKGAGAFTPRYVVLIDGTKIVPYDETLQLNQLGDMITDDPDNDATLYDISGLTVPKPIFIKPSEAETIQLNSGSIVYSSFQGAVWVDTASDYTDKGSSDQPNGNRERPVTTISLAVEIANERGFKKIGLLSNYSLDSNTNIEAFEIFGQSHVNTRLDILSSALTQKVKLLDLNVTGVLDGDTEVRDCIIGDLTYFNGHIHNSSLYGNIILGGGATAFFGDCSASNLEDLPIIDMGGTGQDLVMTDWSGRVTLKNMTGALDDIDIGMDSGSLTLESTITAGNIVVSGSGLLIDNSTANVNSDGLINRELITKSSWDIVHIDTGSGVSGTAFPLGTLDHPVDNLDDAMTIAIANNIKEFHVDENLTLTQDVSGYTFIGLKNQIVNLNGQTCNATIFEHLTLTGTQVGSIRANECQLNNLQGLSGNYTSCVMPSTTPMLVASSSNVLFNNCRSGVPGNDSPVLDFFNGDISFNNRAYSGGIKVINSIDPANTATFEFIAGKFNFDTSNTEGYFAVRGVIDTGGIDPTAGATLIYRGSVSTNREVQYDNCVRIDTSSLTTGNKYPFGLVSNPVNNITDALAIATEYNLSSFHVIGDITLTGDWSGYNFHSINNNSGSITCTNAVLDKTTFRDLKIMGSSTGGNFVATTCIFPSGFTDISGDVDNCQLAGTFSILATGGLQGDQSNSVGSAIIDVNNSTKGCQFGNFSGILTFKNCTSPTAVIGITGYYQATIESSCTDGIRLFSGIGEVTDNGASAYKLDKTVPKTVWEENLHDYLVDDTAGFLLHNTEFLEPSVYINTELAQNGNGTASDPFNNVPDAVDFAETMGWKNIKLLADATIDRTLKNFIVEGVGGLPTVDFNGQNVDKSEFMKVKLTGLQVGSITAKEVVLIDGLSGLNGIYKDSGIASTIVMAEGAIVTLASISILPNSSNPTPAVIDFGALTTTGVLSMRKISGGVNIKNCNTTTKLATLQFEGGQVILDSTCSNGIIKLSGLVDTAITDNSTGSTIVTDDIKPSAGTIANVNWDEPIADHLTAGSTGAQLATASSGGVDYDTLSQAVWDRNLSLHTTDGSAGKLVQTTHDIEAGSWELASNQMIFKDKLGVEIFRVNLFDASGNPSMEEVYRRERV